MAYFRVGIGGGTKVPILLGIFGGWKGSSGTNTDGIYNDSTLEGNYTEYFTYLSSALTCIKACKIRWYLTSKNGKNSLANTYAFVTKNGTEIFRTIEASTNQVKANYMDIDCEVGDVFKVTQQSNDTITVTNSIIFLI